METIIFEWEDAHTNGMVKFAFLQVEQFNATINVVYDYDHDFTESRGTFTSKWENGAIKNPRAKYERNVFEYFLPEYTEEERYKDLLITMHDVPGVTRETAARKEAQRQVNEECLIAADPESQGIIAVGVTATIHYKGVKLGNASIWGVELTSENDSYIDELANEELAQALTEAKETLAELRQDVS